MHILVVDPNIAFCTLLSEELEQLGHTVATALSGAEALQHAAVQPPALAILDMALAEPDAMSIASTLKAQDPQIRLMLIPLMGEELTVEDPSMAIQGILPKPFFLPELPDRIQTAMTMPVVDNPQTTAEVLVTVDAPLEGTGTLSTIVPDAGDLTPQDEEAVETQDQLQGFVLNRYHAHDAQVHDLLDSLIFEIGADGAVLTVDSELLTWVGDFDEAQALSIATVIIQGWRSSEEMARILGREQLQFEQSIAGGSYMLYAVGITSHAILAVALRGSGTLGIIRHRTREAARQIADLCAVF